MGRHDRHRNAAYQKDWEDRPAPQATDDPEGADPAENINPEADLADEDEAGRVHPNFAREIKIGLAALGALLLVLVVVVWSRLRRGDETPPPPEKVASAQPGGSQPSAPETPGPAGAKSPRELTATEPKPPFVPPRPGTVNAGEAQALASDSSGTGAANPFGARGGPSFMPKAAKTSAPAPSTAAPSAAGRMAAGFASTDSLAPEPAGEAVTVGQGPVDPFRNTPTNLAPATGRVAAASPSVSMPMASPSAWPGVASAHVADSEPSVTAGSTRKPANPLRTATPPVEPSAIPGAAFGAISPKRASASQQATGPMSAPPQHIASTQGCAPFAGTSPGDAAGFGMASSSSRPPEAATGRTALTDANTPVGAGPGQTTPRAASSLATTSGLSRQGSRVYVVREGETLYDIARNQLGKASRWGEIYDLNWDQLGNRVDGLVPGMKLLLPDDGGQPAGGLSRNPSPAGTNPTFYR